MSKKRDRDLRMRKAEVFFRGTENELRDWMWEQINNYDGVRGVFGIESDL